MPTLDERRATLTAQRESLTGKLAELSQARAQLVTTLNALDGALALLDELLKEPPVGGAEPKAKPLRRVARAVPNGAAVAEGANGGA